jgi:hypothetical protein
MAPVDEAIAALESRKPGDKTTLQVFADTFGVDRSTLGRRWRGVTHSKEAKILSQQKLNPHQETELIDYIGVLTKRGLAPTRSMIRTFASEIARQPVSESSVTRFLN